MKNKQPNNSEFSQSWPELKVLKEALEIAAKELSSKEYKASKEALKSLEDKLKGLKTSDHSESDVIKLLKKEFKKQLAEWSIETITNPEKWARYQELFNSEIGPALLELIQRFIGG